MEVFAKFEIFILFVRLDFLKERKTETEIQIETEKEKEAQTEAEAEARQSLRPSQRQR